MAFRRLQNRELIKLSTWDQNTLKVRVQGRNWTDAIVLIVLAYRGQVDIYGQRFSDALPKRNEEDGTPELGHASFQWYGPYSVADVLIDDGR